MKENNMTTPASAHADFTSAAKPDASGARIVVLDTETTGLFTFEGHRLLQIGMLEMVNGHLTGRSFTATVNPERDIPEVVTKIHGLTNAIVADKPVFADIARAVRDFIGDDKVYITCRTKEDGYTLDIAFVNEELKRAGIEIVPEPQWVNVRRWSEEMYGNDKATLTAVLQHYGVSAGDRSQEQNHDALKDAYLLASVLPLLQADYARFKGASAGTPKKSPGAGL